VLRRENPYTPGAGRKPPHLAGRDQDQEDFRALIEALSTGGADRSFIFYGLRGVGKTVLLSEFDILASEAGWATTDVQEVGTQADFRATFSQMAVRLLREMSRRHRVTDAVTRALGVVKGFSLLTPGGGVQVQLDISAITGVADSGDPEQDLVELLREIGRAAQGSGIGALFLIDEMHNLDSSSLGAICMAFQAISRNALPVALVGAGLPDLQVRLIKAKPYADRLFEYRELGKLSDPAAYGALVNPAVTHGLEFEDAAARETVRLCAGYPYFLQEYGRELWNAVEVSPITVADVEEIHDIVEKTLERTFFGPRFDLAGDSEQKYLAAMASLGEGPYASAAASSAWGAVDQRQTSAHRDSLIRKGLTWSPRRGQIDFTVPLFAEYLRGNHPLEGFDE
jgi:hypothetical protein